MKDTHPKQLENLRQAAEYRAFLLRLQKERKSEPATNVIAFKG